MINKIDQDVTVYDKSNIYEYDNSIMMHYYPQRIVEILKEQKLCCGQCLELGIGHGYTAEYFSAYFDNYIVVEGDKKIISRFKEEHPLLPINIIQTYFEDFYAASKYDIIICGFVLEHVNDSRLILQRYKEMLTPNGRMFITVPNAETLNRRIGYEAGILQDIYALSEHDIRCGHKRYYSVDTLQEDISSCGLITIKKEGIFLKPITTSQMIKLNMTDEIVQGMLSVGKDYPELCLGLLFEVGRG